MESIAIFDTFNVEKMYGKWKINIIMYLESIIFKIENNYSIYESSFTIKQLQNFNLLSPYKSMNELAEFFLNEKNKIRIEEKDKMLKLKIISNKKNVRDIDLLIHEKSKLSEEIIEQLIKDIKIIKEDNEKLKEKIRYLEKEIQKEKNKNDFNDSITENRIQKLENYYNRSKIQLTNCNLKEMNSFKPHNKECNINSLSFFPSGNIILVSSDRTIKIYDNKFNIIQNIQNAHLNYIFNCSIKDENNFATCSTDIKIWIKKKEKGILKDDYLYKINYVINFAHEKTIFKILYCLNGNIISCSEDKKIKIWEENNKNEYTCIKQLDHNTTITSLLLLNDKNILISSSFQDIIFWNSNSYEKIIYLNNVNCKSSNALQRLDEDRIIVGGDENGIMKIISVNEINIIFEIYNGFKCWAICVIENKGIFLVAGVSKMIKIYRSDNYECINNVKNAHEFSIIGIIQLNDCSIVSYGENNILKVWSL